MEEEADCNTTAVPEKAQGRWRRLLYKRVPILAWAPRYDRLAAVADLVAGVTLGLTLVPQSIAYASLAGLPVHYGLYSSFVGTILYVVFGTVKEVSIGPTGLMALLTLQACRHLPLPYVPLLTFLSGLIVMLLGLLRLGFLVELISPAVTSGFTSATAIIIVVSQLKSLLGLSFVAESILENVTLIVKNFGKVRLGDCLLSLVCCTLLLSLRKVKDIKVNPKRVGLKKALWLLSISRNALVLCAASVFAFCTHDAHKPLFKLSGRVEPGLPPFGLSFSVRDGNETASFPEMVRELGSSILVVPVIMLLANIAIAKAFSSGKPVSATQEMLTLGLVNTVGALFHSMPTCGAFTRSAVSHSSGVRTPAAGLYSGIITIMALLFMTQYFYYIPRASLASVLICAVVFMVDTSMILTLWRHSRGSLAVLLVTVSVSLAWSVEMAVPAGVLADVARVLAALARPKVTVRKVELARGGAVVRVKPTLALLYLNSDYISSRVEGARGQGEGGVPVLLDLSDVMLIDYPAVEALERLAKKFKARNQKLILYNASSEIIEQLEREEWMERRRLRARDETEALAEVTETSISHLEGMPLLIIKEKVDDDNV